MCSRNKYIYYILFIIVIDIVIKIKKIADDINISEYKLQTLISGYENPTDSSDDINKYLDGKYCSSNDALDYTVLEHTYLKISTNSERKYYYLTDSNLILIDDNNFYIYEAVKVPTDNGKGYKLSSYTITEKAESAKSGSCNGGNIESCAESCVAFNSILLLNINYR